MWKRRRRDEELGRTEELTRGGEKMVDDSRVGEGDEEESGCDWRRGMKEFVINGVSRGFILALLDYNSRPFTHSYIHWA